MLNNPPAALNLKSQRVNCAACHIFRKNFDRMLLNRPTVYNLEINYCSSASIQVTHILTLKMYGQGTLSPKVIQYSKKNVK